MGGFGYLEGFSGLLDQRFGSGGWTSDQDKHNCTEEATRLVS